MAVSPDGDHIYAVAAASDSVVAFSRDATTGALTQLGCISEDGSFGACTDGTALVDPYGVTVSPDGDHIYVASASSSAVAIFARDAVTGDLTQLGCVSETGTGGACTDGTALVFPWSVTVSPDGAHVYVAARSSDAVVVSPGTPPPALSPSSAAPARTAPAAPAPTARRSVTWEAWPSARMGSTSTSPTWTDSVAVFTRDTTSGTLTQLPGTDGCISEDGTGGACTDGTALDYPHGIVVTPDGADVYATASTSDAVMVFSRDR